jgi:YesN/AraC family two-component response regulator
VIRILVVDDQALFVDGMRMILDSQDGFEVVGTAADGAEAIARTRELAPDVVLMDIRMPVLDGIAATRAIRTGPSWRRSAPARAGSC